MKPEFLNRIKPKPMNKIESIKKYTMSEGKMSLEWSVDVGTQKDVKDSIKIFEDMIKLLKKELGKK